MSVVVHSLLECKYCDLAKVFLTSIHVPYTIIMYDKNANNYQEEKDKLVNQTNCFTFPQIFINDRFLGGYQEMMHSYETLQFHALCKEIGYDVEVEF